MRRLIRRNVESLTAYTPGQQPGRQKVVKLNTNENPYPPSPAVGRALASLDPGRLRLYPDPVSKRLRERIAHVHGCEVANVFAGNGSDEVLALCTRAFVEDDGAIGYFDPSYSLYPVLADIRNVAKRPVELGRDFEWKTPPRRDFALFFLTRPNAPTGILYPKEEVRRFCRSFPGVVVIDEAYVDFARDNCASLALELDNVLIARTFSKAFSLAGLRVGYAVGSKDLIHALLKLKDSYNLDGISQSLALAALSDLRYMRRNVAKIRKTRERLRRALIDGGHAVYPSDTNFLWMRPSGVSARRLYEHLARNRILIRYFPGDRTGDFVRITVGTDQEVDRLLDAIRGVSE